MSNPKKIDLDLIYNNYDNYILQIDNILNSPKKDCISQIQEVNNFLSEEFTSYAAKYSDFYHSCKFNFIDTNFKSYKFYNDNYSKIVNLFEDYSFRYIHKEYLNNIKVFITDKDINSLTKNEIDIFLLNFYQMNFIFLMNF